MEDKNEIKKCVLCKKSIKKFAKWNDNNSSRRVHRKCWLNWRDFGDRYADFLFCEQKEKKKCVVIKPTQIED